MICMFVFLHFSLDVAHADCCPKGVWDSPADYIGSIVLGEFLKQSPRKRTEYFCLAHTNLTEIEVNTRNIENTHAKLMLLAF